MSKEEYQKEYNVKYYRKNRKILLLKKAKKRNLKKKLDFWKKVEEGKITLE